MSNAARWRKSSFSDTTNCVEVKPYDDGIGVRNSRDPLGEELMFTRGEWSAFIAGAKAGEFDEL